MGAVARSIFETNCVVPNPNASDNCRCVRPALCLASFSSIVFILPGYKVYTTTNCLINNNLSKQFTGGLAADFYFVTRRFSDKGGVILTTD
jgi:hypothetical protein